MIYKIKKWEICGTLDNYTTTNLLHLFLNLQNTIIIVKMRKFLLLLVAIINVYNVHCGEKEAGIRKRATMLYEGGDLSEFVKYLDIVERQYNGLDLGDGISPNVYAFQGVAL